MYTVRLVSLIPTLWKFHRIALSITFEEIIKYDRPPAYGGEPKHVPESFPFSIKYNFASNYAYKFGT